MTKPEPTHKHKLEPYEEEVRLSNVAQAPNGGYVSSLSAIDTIKGFKCACGHTTYVDMERKIA